MAAAQAWPSRLPAPYTEILQLWLLGPNYLPLQLEDQGTGRGQLENPGTKDDSARDVFLFASSREGRAGPGNWGDSPFPAASCPFRSSLRPPSSLPVLWRESPLLTCSGS